MGSADVVKFRQQARAVSVRERRDRHRVDRRAKATFFGVTVLWTIYLAFKYAKLWTDGYDWRDVFRQPRDRDLIDVADDALTYVRAMFNRDQRQAMREQRRVRSTAHEWRRRTMPRLPAVSGDDVVRSAGNYGDRIRTARNRSQRGPALARADAVAERSRIPDVGRSAERAGGKGSRSCRSRLSEHRSRHRRGRHPDALEAEISKLENAANPLDERGSDERVRRLADLKRQRRAVADVSTRRDAVAAKLETCVVRAPEHQARSAAPRTPVRRRRSTSRRSRWTRSISPTASTPRCTCPTRCATRGRARHPPGGARGR